MNLGELGSDEMPVDFELFFKIFEDCEVVFGEMSGEWLDRYIEMCKNYSLEKDLMLCFEYVSQ